MKRAPLHHRTLLRSRAAMRRTRRDRAPRSRSKYKSRTRHTAYMLWVKGQPCLMRGVWGRCSGPVEADHAGRRGAGQKAHDSTCIPLCHRHHQASRFPLDWSQAQRRAWLYAAIVYTQACARAAGVAVPVDPAPMTEYPTTPIDLAWVVLANIAAAHAASVAVRCTGGGPTT